MSLDEIFNDGEITEETIIQKYLDYMREHYPEKYICAKKCIEQNLDLADYFECVGFYNDVPVLILDVLDEILYALYSEKTYATLVWYDPTGIAGTLIIRELNNKLARHTYYRIKTWWKLKDIVLDMKDILKELLDKT